MLTNRYGTILVETGTVLVNDNGSSIVNKTVTKTVTFTKRENIPIVIATMQRNSDSQLARVIEGNLVIDSITNNSVTFAVRNPNTIYGFQAKINYEIIGK